MPMEAGPGTGKMAWHGHLTKFPTRNQTEWIGGKFQPGDLVRIVKHGWGIRVIIGRSIHLRGNPPLWREWRYRAAWPEAAADPKSRNTRWWKPHELKKQEESQ